MLQRLIIRNYGIIADEDIIFAKGLNIITGETGAGKSILLGALQLTLGQRADSKMLFNKEKKLIVEATYAELPGEVTEILEKYDLDVADELLMRREILPSGKSRAFVNDTPVTLEIMQNVSAYLLDLHQQFESLAIHTSRQQYALLDGFARHESIVNEYAEGYNQYRELTARIRDLEEDIRNNRREKDFLEFELQELTESVPDQATYDTWEADFAFQDQATEVLAALGKSIEALRDNDHSIIGILRTLSADLGKFGDAGQEIRELSERMHSVAVEIEDIAYSIDKSSDSLSPDPARKEELEQKLSDVRRLMIKHNLQEISALQELMHSFEAKLGVWGNSEKELDEAKEEHQKLEKQLFDLAAQISEVRTDAAADLSDKVTSGLAELEMKNARFEIAIAPTEQLNGLGTDEIEFLFSANLGSEKRAVAKVASGGELSRLNLCLKSSVSKVVNLPTLVFDEIDSGVSGQVALKMGNLLKELAGEHQIIMITHSPQIAARGDVHLMVRKADVDERTITRISALSENERVQEIAKMLSGDPPSEAAVLNAKQLVQN